MIIFKIIVYSYLIAPFISLLTILFDKIIIKKQKKYKTNKYADIYVLLPAFKEQKIVKDTIDWFNSIKYKGKIKYIIITTEKEELENKTKIIKEKTTNEVVKKYLKQVKDYRFVHMHYPKTNGNKSSQMNYAINIINEGIKNKENTYISVYDFDSRPDKETFNELNKIIQLKNNTDEIQQIPLEIRNYKEISGRSIMMTIHSLQHMIRSLVIEKFKFQLYTLFKINIPKYFMGACMHLKLSTLLENKLFPIFVDDLTLGYRYSIQNKKCEYLYSNNYALIPNDLKGYFGSSTLIFKGLLTFVNEIRIAKGHIVGKIGMAVFGLLNLLEFCIIPYMFLIYYIYSLITLNFNIFTIITIIIPILWSLSSYIVVKSNNIKYDNKFKSLLSILISPTWFIFRPMGFLRYTFKKIDSIMNNKEITYSKTER